MRSLKSRGGLTRGKGFTSSVRTLWLQSMHSCADIHNAMSEFTLNKHNTSDQHEEMGKSRIQRDYQDLQKILQWFETNDPFDSNRTELQSLSTGLIADDAINCDEIEKIGSKIQSNLDGVAVVNASIKRKEQIKSLSTLKNVVRINNQNVSIDPALLFTRLIVIAERCADIKSYFDYELTPVPTSLFVDNFMRKPNKASLIETLLGKGYQLVAESDIVRTKYNVVDGGALLRKVFDFDNILKLLYHVCSSKINNVLLLFHYIYRLFGKTA